MTHESRVHRWYRPLLLLLLAAAFGMRLHELTRQDIWWDEARNLDVALRPFLQVAVAPELDIHPPVYFWLLHAWGRLMALAVGQTPEPLAFAGRFLSVAAGLLGIALAAQLARRAGSAGAGLIAALVGALSPFWLAESQEARMYTVGFTLLTGAALAFLTLLKDPRGRPGSQAQWGRRAWLHRYRPHVVFVVLSALALLTHYNAVFILVAWYLWWGGWALLQPDRWAQIRVLLACGSAMTLLVLPVAPIALRQIPTYANPNLTIPTIADYLRANWEGYLGGYAYDPAALLLGHAPAWLWTVAALLAGGLLLGFLRSRGAGQRTLGFLLAWLAGGLALYYVAVLDRGAFNIRYSSFVTPALYALLGVALAEFGRLWKPLGVIATLVVLVGMAPAARADIYDPRFDRSDISGVTEWLRTSAGPDAVVFADQKYPFGFYYQRYAIDANVEEIAGQEQAPARYLFVDINTIDEQLNRWAGQAGAVYWVQWFESDTDPRRAVSFLLDRAGTRAGERQFQGYSVDWWSLEPPNEFVLAENFLEAEHRWPSAVGTVAVDLPAQPIQAGEPLFAAIRWQRLNPGPVERPLKARVALYDAGGSRKAQSDERLLNDRHLLPAEWSMDERPINVYKAETAADLAPGEYSVGLLVYDADTLEPLELVDEAGNPAGIEATIGTVQVTSP